MRHIINFRLGNMFFRFVFYSLNSLNWIFQANLIVYKFKSAYNFNGITIKICGMLGYIAWSILISIINRCKGQLDASFEFSACDFSFNKVFSGERRVIDLMRLIILKWLENRRKIRSVRLMVDLNLRHQARRQKTHKMQSDDSSSLWLTNCDIISRWAQFFSEL